MSEEIEIEFKSMLTKSEYEHVFRFYQLSLSQTIQQTNWYYDTVDWQLKENHMGLRIRPFDKHAEATLKIPQAVGLLEVTDSLTPEQVEAALTKHRFAFDAKEILQRLDLLNINFNELKLIGKLTTQRAELNVPEGKLALDESWYSGQHDFELELEVSNDQFSLQDFKQFLHKFDFPYRATQNKIARAVAAQQQLDNRKENPR
ncbi:MAG: CYTH domain-containing protein [Enterococcus viikkiensis]